MDGDFVGILVGFVGDKVGVSAVGRAEGLIVGSVGIIVGATVGPKDQQKKLIENIKICAINAKRI